MKIISLLFFLSSFAHANTLQNLEVDCWYKSVDEDGSFLCEYALAMGKNSADSSFMVPTIAALDAGGPKTVEQADRACKAMGFSFARRFELVNAEKNEWQISINSSLRDGLLMNRTGTFLQHISCAD